MSWKLLDVIGKPAKAGKGWPNKRQLCFLSLLIRFVTNNFVLLLICAAMTAARFATTGRSGSGSTACEANVAAQSVVSRGRMTMHPPPTTTTTTITTRPMDGGQPVARHGQIATAPVDEPMTYMIKPYANPRHSGHFHANTGHGTTLPLMWIVGYLPGTPASHYEVALKPSKLGLSSRSIGSYAPSGGAFCQNLQQCGPFHSTTPRPIFPSAR